MTPRDHLEKIGFTILLLLFGGFARAQTADDLFDITTLQEIRLTVDPEVWAQFKANYTKNDYAPATLAWREIVLNIGIRHRGTGSRSGTKPYLGLKIDQYVRNQRFLGMASLRLKNSIQDPSFLHERLGMLLFRRMGLPAPREAYAKLYVNGEYSGLYVIVEEIDNTFLDRVFGEHSGCLYGYNWVDEYHFEYLGPDPALYSPARFEPKSCPASTDPASLVAMIQAINTLPEEAFRAQLSQYIDTQQFLNLLAVENVLAEWDGILGHAGMNNFYLYRLSGTNRFLFIPWDKDWTFEEADRSIWQNTEANVLTRRMFQFPELAESYQDEATMTAIEAGDYGGWLEQELDHAYAQMFEAARADPVKPSTNTEFEFSVNATREFVHRRAGVVISEAGPQQPPDVSGIVGSADGAPDHVVAGSIASIFGTNLGFAAVAATSLPLPTTLDQTTVRVNGIAAPLFFVSPEQINFQVPWQLAGQTDIFVTVAVKTLTNNSQAVYLTAGGPALFSVNGSGGGQGAILISGTSELAAPTGSVRGAVSRPVHRGEFISIYCTGLGPVTTQPDTGTVPAADVPSHTVISPIVEIGGAQAVVSFSGLAPGFVGLYQVNAQVPGNAPAGIAIPVLLTAGDDASNVVTIAIE